MSKRNSPDLKKKKKKKKKKASTGRVRETPRIKIKPAQDVLEKLPG